VPEAKGKNPEGSNEKSSIKESTERCKRCGTLFPREYKKCPKCGRLKKLET